MTIENRLKEIWSEDYISSLPAIIKERGYAFADNVQRDILIIGFNPSFREEDPTNVVHGPIENIWNNEKYDNYWSPIKKMLHNGEIDLRNRADYLDIFYFKEQEQSFLRENILSNPNGVRFVVDQLNLTMHIIEDIVKPKLLIVKNKEAQTYFGKLEWVWMGYEFEHIQDFACGELCRISGLKDSKERIAPEITQSNIVGSYAFFTQHINQYVAIDKRATPQMLKAILDLYDAESYVSQFAIK